MPVEIKEMIVRAVVDPISKGSATPPGNDFPQNSSKAQIVADCVKEVMKIMRTKKER